MTSITAVVVDHATPEKAAALVADLRASPLVSQIVVVENGGPWPGGDLAGPRIGAEVVEVENRGYGSAVNAGAARATGDVLLICNPDLRIPDPRSLDVMAAELEDPATGLVGATIVRPDGSPEAQVSPLQPSLRHSLLPRYRPRPMPDGRLVLDNLNGALLAVRRSTWERVGGFDEGYFMYFEDTDLCRRVADLGLQLVRSEAVAVHEVGGAGASDRRAAWYATSQLRVFRRWRPRWEVVALQALRRLPSRPIRPSSG